MRRAMIRIFKHYTPTSLLVLAILEFAVLVAAVYAGVAIRFWDESASDVQASGLVYPIFPKAVTFAVVVFGFMVATGLYQRDHGSLAWYYGRVAASMVLGLAVMTLLFYLIPALFLGRGAFGLAFVIAFAGILLTRYGYLLWTGPEATKRRVLVLGTGSRAARIDALERSGNGRQGFQIVGYLPLDGAERPQVDRAKILPDRGSICCLAHKYRVDEVVVGIPDRRGGRLPMDEMLACKLDGIDVVDLTSFFERETGHVQLQTLNSSWMIFSDGFARGQLRDVLKRAFDVAASSVLLLMTWPVLLVAAILIKLDSPGPVLYRQVRIGEGGKHFTMFKLRSMRADAEAGGNPQWATDDDPRVTRVGRVLRQLRLDELPQLFNVLKGDMSVVGPRPERPYFVERLAKQIPYYSCRHSIKPGITGWAQIRYRYGSSSDDALEKLQYDLYYVKNHSLFLDSLILVQTVSVALFGKGAR